MSFDTLKNSFQADLQEIKDSGLWKTERHIDSDQKSQITLEDGS